MVDRQQPSGSAPAATQQIASLMAAAAATAAAGAAAAWYWRSSQRVQGALRSTSAPAEVEGSSRFGKVLTAAVEAAPTGADRADSMGTSTPPLRADLAARLATDSSSWVRQ